MSTQVIRAANWHLMAVSFIIALLSVTESSYAAPRYAAIVVDGHNGKVLFSKNADDFRYPASLTKIMTLYLLFNEIKAGRVSFDTKLIVTANASSQQPSRLGLKPGDTIRVIDAIRALVTKSANDVAVVVAENLAGTEADFAKAMTLRAHRLGMTRTRFMNASGLPNSSQVTTARDMITLSRRLMSDFPKLYSFFKTRYFTYRGRRYRNHNSLLFNYSGTDGIKTGYTRASGFNLVASVRKNKKHLVAVVLGGRSARKRNAHMRSILNRSMRKAIAYVPPKRPKRVKIAAKKPAPLPPRNPIVREEHNGTVANEQGSSVSEQSDSNSSGRRTDLHMIRASKAQSQLLIQNSTNPLAGPYQIQVGAFATIDEAHARLIAVSTKANDVLNGHPPVTLRFSIKQKDYIRARFAAFTEDKARATCKLLKKRLIDCFVMPAE